jgi:hypothetical protein
MNKKLEALNRIEHALCRGIQSINTLPLLLSDCNDLKNYLTPPTADEVCEAIQKELDYGTVEYFGGNREFMFFNHGEKQNITDCYGDIYKITGFYKSSTITLIGRFYEAQQ